MTIVITVPVHAAELVERSQLCT